MFKLFFFVCITLACSALCGQTSQQFQQECLDKHNELRALHGSPPLVLDEEVQAQAQKWADHLAVVNKLEHSAGTGYGENLLSVWGAQSIDGKKAPDGWYGEIERYNWENPSLSNVSHFTQIVWKNSTRLGCAMSEIPEDTKIFVVANYSPSGNWKGGEKGNVLPLIE